MRGGVLWKYERHGVLRKLTNLVHFLKLSIRCRSVCLECLSAVLGIWMISEQLVPLLQELHRCAAGFVKIVASPVFLVSCLYKREMPPMSGSCTLPCPIFFVFSSLV